MDMLRMTLRYDNTPICVREHVRFSEEQLPSAYEMLQTYEAICEHLIISTCNRTEIVAVVSNVTAGKEAIQSFMYQQFPDEAGNIDRYCQYSEGKDVIRHLFRLACGLDSAVLGETQILGQVRQAFVQAKTYGSSGKILGELQKRVLQFAKNAHHTTAIGQYPTSLSYIAAQVCKNNIKHLEEARVGIVGIGEMASLAIKHLQAIGLEHITVCNRTNEHANQITKQYHIQSIEWEELPNLVAQVDILISATSADHFIITPSTFAKRERTNEAELICIDLALPRDIDPTITKLPSVRLYDVDHLQGVVDDNLAARKEAAAEIETMLDEEIRSFYLWLNTLHAAPVLHALREKSFAIQAKTVESMFRKIPSLDEREKKVIEKHTKSIVNQMMEQPIEQVKKLCEKGHFETKKDFVVRIFGLEDEAQYTEWGETSCEK